MNERSEQNIWREKDLKGGIFKKGEKNKIRQPREDESGKKRGRGGGGEGDIFKKRQKLREERKRERVSNLEKRGNKSEFFCRSSTL